MTANNRCRTCGACCACFTVVVDPTEMKTPEVYHPPFDLIVPMKNRGHAMKGTEGKQKRCAALNGIVGQAVYCAIYDTRPASFRGFLAAWGAGVVNPKCDMARAAYGLFAFSLFCAVVRNRLRRLRCFAIGADRKECEPPLPKGLLARSVCTD